MKKELVLFAHAVILLVECILIGHASFPGKNGVQDFARIASDL